MSGYCEEAMRKIKAACRERCAEFGDPPCHELEGTGPIDDPFVWVPCSECLVDAGEIPPPAPTRDPDAAIGDLF